MKKTILPVIFAIAFFFLIRVVTPKIELSGLIIVVAFGLMVGAMLNNLIFKGKK
jgi:hypothetical protein